MKHTGFMGGWQRTIPRVAALALAALVCAGCRGGAKGRLSTDLQPDAVCILRPVVSNVLTGVGNTILAEAFPGAATIRMDEGDAALARCRDQRRVLIVPQVRDVPTWYWPLLTNHLAEGGAVVFWGADPFAMRYEKGRNKPIPGSEFIDLMARSAGYVPDVSSVQSWLHVNAAGGRGGPMRVDLSQSIPWPAVIAEATNFVSWDALLRDDLEPGAIPSRMTSLAFYARADERATRLALECEEEDGSHWSRLVPVSPEWRLVAAHELEFVHQWGGSGRGGPGDHVAFSRLRRISIGLSMNLAPQEPGAHTFAVSDFRAFDDPRPSDQVGAWPDIPMLSPPYRHYGFASARLRVLESGRVLLLPRTPMQGPLPRPVGCGGESGAPYRWIPLVTAENSAGDILGWPASLYVEPVEGRTSRQWAWVGLDPGADYGSAVKVLLQLAAGRLYTGRFLVKAGVDRYTFAGGEQFAVSARIATGIATAAPLRVSAELLDDRGMSARRVTAAATVEDARSGRPIELNLGVAARLSGRTRDMVVRVALMDAEGQRFYDILDQPIRVLSSREAPVAESVGVSSYSFTLGRRPFVLFGVNYWPLAANGRRPGAYRQHWLDPGEYNPALVQRDLDRLQEAGINFLAVQYLDEKQAPQLRYFLQDARMRNMWVLLYVPHLSPFDQDLEHARRLIEAADLANQPAVCGFDIAWEPKLGREQERARFDGDWRDWLMEQFGSFEHAEHVIGRPLWRHDGRVTGPPDDELTTDEGGHRVAVSVYRRFVDDWVSRRYGYVRRFLSSLGCRQLIGARSGFGGSGNAWADPYLPIDLASGTVHLDFISPEAWGLMGNRAAFSEAGFITAYARGASGGKPVLWAEYGVSVGENPEPQDLENQARLYDLMLDLLIRSHAGGGCAWWYPGGFRVDERSDMGVVNPSGTWRPAGDVMRGFNQRMRRDQSVPLPWHGREVVRSAHARGLSGLWDEWREVYRAETMAGRMEELRPAGFGRLSRDLPALAVGGMHGADPCPLEYVNGEWGAIRVEDADLDRKPGAAVHMKARQTLAADLINTGPATWSASAEGLEGAVWLKVRDERGREQTMPVRAEPFGERVTIVWTPTDPGRWTLRPWLAGASSFGETLVVQVE